jgi:uncharacterized protein YdaU (DUF1376 family)
MTSKVDIWMPLYIADYLADTSRLTTEQHGAYLLLLIDYWRNGSLPDNDSVLAQITRLSPDAWSNARSTLQAYFKHEGGMWVHGRVEAELSKAKESRDKAKTRAISGANARWNATRNATSITQAMPTTMLVQCPSPSPSEVNKSITSADADFEKFWEVWPSSQRKVAKQKCLAVWKQKKLSQKTDQIINHVKIMRSTEQWVKGFDPAPLTYLNQGRYDDGVAEDMRPAVSASRPTWDRRQR